ncbi:MAG: hypothetical protein DU481_08515 [Nitrosomonas sp.]
MFCFKEAIPNENNQIGIEKTDHKLLLPKESLKNRVYTTSKDDSLLQHSLNFIMIIFLVRFSNKLFD